MQYKAVLSNAHHPEYGVVSVPFPILRNQYEEIIGMLEELEIGDARLCDCQIDEISDHWPVLKNLERTSANIDELDYLAKRLDSFDVGEAAQFQAMASRLELHDMTELINLTFCCQMVTVITDFSDLNAVGKDHYMNLNGGCASTDELEKLDGAEVARRLIDYNVGRVTPFGVVYDNDMELEQLYDGRHFPAYLYEPCVMEVAMTHRDEPEDTKNITYLYLPMTRTQIERAMLRAGVNTYADMRLRFCGSELPEEVDAALDFENESLGSLNRLSETVAKLDRADLPKLAAAVLCVEPEYADEIAEIAKNLELFDFVPKVSTPEEYGRYMIQESGRFEFDENLEDFYDYTGYAEQRIREEQGEFNDRGYVAYRGTLSMSELLQGEPTEAPGFEMGGME